jgi:hypothetical protein
MSSKKMTYDDFDNRIYAKWTDVLKPIVATIEEVRFEEMPNAEIDKRTGKKKLTIVLYFPEEQFRFGVALSAKVNRRALAAITGSEDPMDAVGTTVELFNDPTVRNPQTGEYGSVRIRQAPAPARETPTTKSLDEANAELAADTANSEIPY